MVKIFNIKTCLEKCIPNIKFSSLPPAILEDTEERHSQRSAGVANLTWVQPNFAFTLYFVVNVSENLENITLKKAGHKISLHIHFKNKILIIFQNIGGGGDSPSPKVSTTDCTHYII